MATQWKRLKDEIKTQQDPLSDYIAKDLPTDINTLRINLTNYIQKGGVSQNPANDGDYNDIIRLYTKIKSKENEYRQLNVQLSNKIKEISTAGDLGKILQENGELQSQVSNLEVKLKASNEDVKSAELRDELLRSQDSNITKHQVFMLGRPLRPSSIPYLWALSVLFIGASLLVFQTQGPPLLEPLYAWYSTPSVPGTSFFGSTMWIALTAALAIVILFLSLRVANVI